MRIEIFKDSIFYNRELNKNILINSTLVAILFLTSFLQFKFKIFNINIYLNNFILLAILAFNFKKFLINIKEVFQFKRNRVLVIFSTLSLLSIVVSYLMNLGTEGVSARFIIKYGVFLIFIPLVAIALKDEIYRYSRYYLKMIIISFILYESILILSLYLGLYTIDNVGNYYILNQHKNATGMLLSIGFIITFLYSVFYKSRWTLLPVAVASTLILIVGCRAALLAILFSIALFIILRYIKFKELISYLGIVLILKLFTVVSLPQQIIDAQVNRFYKIVYLNRYISDSKTKKESEDKKITSASSRIVLWKQALELFKQKPLFGVGFGGFYIDVKGWLSKRDEPHNGVLQILSEGGIFSLLSFLGLLIFGLIKKEKSRLDIIIFITLVMYIFQDMFGILWISGDGHIFWFLFFIYAFTTNNPSSKDLIYVK